MTAAIDMAGITINGIMVLSKLASKNGKVSWFCVCKCGNEFEATGTALRQSKTKACAICSKKNVLAAATKHGLVGTKEYNSYNAMKQRCYDRKNKRYARYGGRGIIVCDRWMQSFGNFLSDMGKKPSDSHSIERININDGYEPGNCKWATREEQANNRSNNSRIEINGVTKNISQWARESGVNRTVILRRINRGLHGESLIYKGVIK